MEPSVFLLTWIFGWWFGSDELIAVSFIEIVRHIVSVGGESCPGDAETVVVVCAEAILHHGGRDYPSTCTLNADLCNFELYGSQPVWWENINASLSLVRQ